MERKTCGCNFRDGIEFFSLGHQVTSVGHSPRAALPYLQKSHLFSVRLLHNRQHMKNAYIMCSEPRLQWSHLTQHKWALPKTHQIHYRFGFKFNFLATAYLENFLLLLIFSNHPQWVMWPHLKDCVLNFFPVVEKGLSSSKLHQRANYFSKVKFKTKLPELKKWLSSLECLLLTI